MENSEKIELTEEMREANLQKVQFRVPAAKNIVSPHSGSILATEEPKITLTFEMDMKIRSIFKSLIPEDENATAATIHKDKLVDLVISALDIQVKSHDTVKECVFRLLHAKFSNNEKETISLNETIEFIQNSYYAPAYNYGQRFRRCANRCQIDDVISLLCRGKSTIHSAQDNQFTASARFFIVPLIPSCFICELCLSFTDWL